MNKFKFLTLHGEIEDLEYQVSINLIKSGDSENDSTAIAVIMKEIQRKLEKRLKDEEWALRANSDF